MLQISSIMKQIWFSYKAALKDNDIIIRLSVQCWFIYFTLLYFTLLYFTVSHLADTFIQSALQIRKSN